MRLVVTIFDHCAAYQDRQGSGAFISKSAISGDDLASLDTYTGLPYELEQEIIARYHQLDQRLQLPKDIWQDLSTPSSFDSAEDNHDNQSDSRSRCLNASAAEFKPGEGTQVIPAPRKKARGISEIIQPVFSPLRSLDWRFGFIEVDYLEAPVRMSYQQSAWPPLRSPMSQSSTLELPAIFEKRARSNTQDAEVNVRGDSARPKSRGAGTLDLGFGVIHLYNDASELEELESESKSVSQQKKRNTTQTNGAGSAEKHSAGGGTMVAILGVPSNWTTADFLAFIGESVDSLQQMRIMRWGANFS
jgi:hypothetical protein